MKAILAIDSKNGLGIGNGLAWSIPEEMAHFREITKDKTVLMGRNTYLSFPKPLKGRTHVVFSSERTFKERFEQEMFKHKCCGWVIDNEKELLKFIHSAEGKNAFLIGGKQMYETYLPLCEEIYLSRVKGDHNCDVHLQYDFNSHKIVKEIEYDEFTLQILTQ